MVFQVNNRMFTDGRQGLLLMVYLTFKYNDAITCMCLTYHLKSHVNQTPKMQISEGLKLECTLR